MSVTQSSELSDRNGNGQSDSYGSEYKNQLTILNSNFLSSIQKALKKSPDACLAPLVMDYLQFLYPLVKSPQDSTSVGKLKSNDSIDFCTVGKFFQELKNNMTNSNGSCDDNSSRSGSNDSASLSTKASVSTKPFFTVPSTIATTQCSSQTSSPSLFGQIKPPPALNPTLNFNAPVSISTSNLTKPSTELDSKTTNMNMFQSSGSSALTSVTFGASANTSSISSAAKTSTTSVPSTFGLSSLSKPAPGSGSGSTTTMSSFSFGSLSSAPTTSLTTTFGSNGFQSSGSTFSSSLFGAPSSSGFGQSGFGSTMSTDGSKPSGVNGASETVKEDSDEDSPPKPDHVPVVESDSVYSQRVKLFEMEGKAFKDLGIGNLFVKEIADGKHQLVVRADNSLGSILINVVLNESMPIRQNKPTNVLATFPNSDGKPATYLFRVKEESVGNELFKNLEKYKSK